MWRNTPIEENEDHKMTVHIFGRIDSPFIANWVIKWTASDQSNEYLVDIINTIHENFYMDDYLDYLTLLKKCLYLEFFRIRENTDQKNSEYGHFSRSFSSNERVLIPFRKLFIFWQNCGFRLTKWLFNNKNTIKSVQPTERSPEIVDLDLDDIPVERTLGTSSGNLKRICSAWKV